MSIGNTVCKECKHTAGFHSGVGCYKKIPGTTDMRCGCFIKYSQSQYFKKIINCGCVEQIDIMIEYLLDPERFNRERDTLQVAVLKLLKERIADS